VCGLPSILIFSRLMQGRTGSLLSYDAYDETATQSAVTYASMLFTDAQADTRHAAHVGT